MTKENPYKQKYLQLKNHCSENDVRLFILKELIREWEDWNDPHRSNWCGTFKTQNVPISVETLEKILENYESK